MKEPNTAYIVERSEHGLAVGRLVTLDPRIQIDDN